MAKYIVTLTLIYNGSMLVEAGSEDEALRIAQDSLDSKALSAFPDNVDLPNDGIFQFGEATADYCDKVDW